MSEQERAQKFDDVQEAIEEVHWRFALLCGATNPLAQAHSLTNLADAVSDLATWHDSWDVDSGTLSWEREDAEEIA